MSRHPALADLAALADAELQLRSGHAWVIAVGPIDVARATAFTELIAALMDHPALDRVSVDLTCASTVDAAATAAIDELGTGHIGSVDLTTAAPFGARHLRAA